MTRALLEEREMVTAVIKLIASTLAGVAQTMCRAQAGHGGYAPEKVVLNPSNWAELACDMTSKDLDISQGVTILDVPVKAGPEAWLGFAVFSWSE
jgi:hypothetical protein